MKQIHFYVVVPIFNERGNLEGLIRAFRDLQSQFGDQYVMQFLLVDDGSTDNSAAVAKDLAQKSGLTLIVLRHERNFGPGYAFGTAFEYLASRLEDDDWVASMEGDNTSRYKLLRQMMMRTLEGYDVILASPYSYGGGIHNTSRFRLILSHGANGFLKGLVGIHGILTMSSFFRLHRGRTMRLLQACYGSRIITRVGFEGVVEMLIKMIMLGTSISEVPMVLDTSSRVGKSKMKILKTIWGYLLLGVERKQWQAQAQKLQPNAGLPETIIYHRNRN